MLPGNWQSMSVGLLWEQCNPLALAGLPIEVLTTFPNDYLLAVIGESPEVLVALPIERRAQFSASPLGTSAREIELQLNGDNAAVLTMRFQDSAYLLIERGTWKQSALQVTVQFTELMSGRPVQDKLVLDVSGDHMVASQWDRSIYGLGALQFTQK